MREKQQLNMTILYKITFSLRYQTKTKKKKKKNAQKAPVHAKLL